MRIQEDDAQTPASHDIRRVTIEEEKKGHEQEQFVIGQNPSTIQIQEELKEEESDGSSCLNDEDDEEEKAKYKKYYTEQKKKTRGSMVEDAENLFKVKTQKEIYYEDRDKLAASKSYIYLAKGLSDELSNDPSYNQNGLNGGYRSAFFENDQDLENYNQQLKEALLVQFQKEINISGHIEIKLQYEAWVVKHQLMYKKTSPCKF